jgi:mono/diheme cytochrome c family protein
MKKLVVACIVSLPLVAAAQQSPKPAVVKPAASHPPAVTTMLPAEQTALVKQYCAGCHSDRGKAGGLSLASFDAANVLDHPDSTEKMIRKLRAGMMPPAGARQR